MTDRYIVAVSRGRPLASDGNHRVTPCCDGCANRSVRRGVGPVDLASIRPCGDGHPGRFGEIEPEPFIELRIRPAVVDHDAVTEDGRRVGGDRDLDVVAGHVGER